MYVKHQFKIKEVHRNTWWNIITVMIISAIVVYLYHYQEMSYLAIPLGVPMTLGTAISLILAFRTNASYGRWWEARQIWGAIVNDSRSLVRQALLNFKNDEQVKQLARRQIAWNYALSLKLRGKEVLPTIEKYLSSKEFKAIQKHGNIPNGLLLFHERQIKDLHLSGVLDSFQYTHLSSTVQRLTDAMGKCERIKNTIFPTQYSFYIHFTIMSFVTILPFGVMKELEFLAVFIAGLIAFLFLTIEHLAIDLQNPFNNEPNDTPMTALSRTIEINILDMLGEEHELKPILPENGVLM